MDNSPQITPEGLEQFKQRLMEIEQNYAEEIKKILKEVDEEKLTKIKKEIEKE